MKLTLQKLSFSFLLYSTIFLISLGVSLIFLYLIHTYTLVVDNEKMLSTTIAFSPAQVLRHAGYQVSPEDYVFPSRDQFNPFLHEVQLNHARQVQIITPDNVLTFNSPSLIPANLLQQAKLPWFPRDLILQNGTELDINAILPPGQPAILQFRPAKQLIISIDGQDRSLFTQKQTLADALLEAGIHVAPKDVLSHPLEIPLSQTNRVELRKARELLIRTKNGEVKGQSAAMTVGAALHDLDFSLQFLDYTQPAETEPIPVDGLIRLVKVTELLEFQTVETPFNTSWQEDPNTQLDTTSTIIQGQVGLVVTRTRSRLEDEKLFLQAVDGPWQASTPMDGVLGQGTKVVVHSEVVDGVTLNWWRKVNVYATGYKPSSQGGGTGTASGLKLTKGIIAVTLDWYRAGMKFQKVYVPGYGFGTIADTGGGIPGRPWIDLGFDNDNYVSWHQWTTMYFLEPVPSYIPTYLP